MVAPPSADAAVSDGAFAAAMAGLGPFEARPRLAVAVSGGADSMALAVLAHRWVDRRHGWLTALIVDHGLRPNAGEEAAAVAAQLARHAIDARILPIAVPPGRNVLAAARAGRYAALSGACEAAGILHLLLGHHRDDQAETVLLNLARGSGLDGLTAMPASLALPAVRLLRPLLAIAKPALIATCHAHDLRVVDDPSNRAERFARARVRAALDAAGTPALAARLATTAAHLSADRMALEATFAPWLVRHVALGRDLSATIDRAALAGVADTLAQRALARVTAIVGGSEYLPRARRVAALLTRLRGANGRSGQATLAGCIIRWRGDRIMLVREAAAIAAPAPLAVGRTVWWDGRFVAHAREPGWTIGAVGAALAARLRRVRPRLSAAQLAAMPVLSRLDGSLSVPHLSYCPDTHAAATLDSSPGNAPELRAHSRHVLVSSAWLGNMVGSAGIVEKGP